MFKAPQQTLGLISLIARAARRFGSDQERTSPLAVPQRSPSGLRPPESPPFRKVRSVRTVALPGLLLALALAAVATLSLDTHPTSAETSPRQVEVGQNHACVLETDGLVTCWGEDAAGQVSDWGGLRYRSQQFSSISAGSFLTCGIQTDGSVMCWGWPEQENGTHREADHRDWSEWTANPDADYAGWVNTPPDTVKFKPGSISVGNFHACAIQTSGELSCWGKAGDARLVIPTEDDGEVITDWTTVEAGWAHACAVRAEGSVVCFGRTSFGRSDGPSGPGPFTDVTLGVYNGCALAEDGSVECWGGHSDLAQYNPLINTPPAGVTFTAIEMSTTEFYSCGIAQEGAIHCWGIVTSEATLPRVSPPAGSFASISVGSSNSCALNSTGDLTCWGDDNNDLFAPPDGAFTQTSGGTGFSCALKSDQSVACWGGDNVHQQLDAPAGTFALVSSGDTHSCAIRSDNTVACWGGVAGDPPATHASAIAPAGTFITLDAGPDLTCGIKTDETIECWGDDSHDRLNAPSGSYSRVAVGATHVCAIATDQSMVCWGEAVFFDAEGDGIPDDIDGKGNHTATIPPAGDHRYVDITAGEGHTCAIRDDNKAVCWGYHPDDRNNVPGAVNSTDGFGVHEYSNIATGGPNNCALRSNDGSLRCWNHEKPQYWPSSEILAMTGFKSLGAGASHMCGIDSSDGLVCWGVAGIAPVPAELATAPAPATVTIDLVAWRSVRYPDRYYISTRAEGLGWTTHDTPIELDTRSTSRRFYRSSAVSVVIDLGDGLSTSMDVVVWRAVRMPDYHYISTRPEGQGWTTHDDAPLDLSTLRFYRGDPPPVEVDLR